MSNIVNNKKFVINDEPYIIAEIGVNHGGSIALARRLIDEAKIGGADAVKFQTYKAEKIASKDSPPYWDTSKEDSKSQYLLFKKFDSFDEQDYLDLYDYCKELDIDFLSTPFDNDAVDFLNPLMPFFKIASADITNIPLLRKVASCQKPVLLSTGASTLREIDAAINELKAGGAPDVSLMHCMLNYPTKYEDAELGTITTLKKNFPSCVIGYSDHTFPEKDMLTLLIAVSKGAKIIEKHFTHDKNIIGNDHFHSMDKEDLSTLRNNIKRVIKISGITDLSFRNKEVSAIKNARRSIVLSKDIKSGDIITEDKITYKRPASGISTIHWDEVLGRTVIRDLKSDDILHWKDIN